ncbi:MAG: (2Fe-2S) ferredoxin domain-containing protein [Actinomycetota bacterium]|nr:(2Fe-2S) ferredoxin domain-containing protein [Actinomycetota bacterium]
MNPNFLEAAISGKEKSKKAKEAKKAKVRDYEAHVLVCKGGDCKKRGSKEVKKALKNELRIVGMNRDVRLDSVECLGLCKHGPNAIVYPGGTWYLGLDENDAKEVARSHIKGGEPVEHLAAEFRPKKRAN